MEINKKNLTMPWFIVAFSLLLFIVSFIELCEAEVVTTPTVSSNSFNSNNPIQRSLGSSFFTVKEAPSPGGFWKTKREWKAYWVKDWAIRKIYVPVWKRVWGPADLREWVPTGVAKPRPGIKLDSIIH